jgi:hypothetical protein
VIHGKGHLQADGIDGSRGSPIRIDREGPLPNLLLLLGDESIDDFAVCSRRCAAGWVGWTCFGIDRLGLDLERGEWGFGGPVLSDENDILVLLMSSAFGTIR